MPLNPIALSAALAPTVISTWISHYIHRKSNHKKPTVHLSYDEGLHIIRDFLAYVAKYPIEDLQAFSRLRVPSPHWVKTDSVTIPAEHLASAATDIIDQLGPEGVGRVGGKEWWQWRGPSGDLKGEWIEMRRDYNERKQSNVKCKRIILYIHGGAFSFGSVDTHRYQLQRHARKLKGLVFARYVDLPEYRLCPQFPFPCSLQDCLAAYHYVLTLYDPSEIIFAGDSAGGGMVLSMLCIIRDRGLPLPAAGILISPWVDLTHSFPSIVTENPGDYLPPYGLRHKPSRAWPPPNADEIAIIEREGWKQKEEIGKIDADENVKKAMPQKGESLQDTVQGFSVYQNGPSTEPSYPGEQGASDPTDKAKLESVSVSIDGTTIEVKDQIQMYTTNQLLSHPLVSPVLQPSLGGLPPLFILSGGAEMLRDEQFYVAHKAANPTAYPPSDAHLDDHDPDRKILNKYPPTYVQLQVWDDLCHVAPTLSFTRPAKYMFRAIAQFGAWALARAQNSEVDILHDDDISPIPSDEEGSRSPGPGHYRSAEIPFVSTSVGKAGDPLPAFRKHMIRQRVDEGGYIHPLDPPSSYEVLQIPSSQVGAINPKLVKRWVEGKKEWDEKFAKEKLRMQQERLHELSHGLHDFDGETPPPSSLAARRAAPGVLPQPGKKNYPLFLWSFFASKHDRRTIGRENKAEGAGRRASINAEKTGSTTDDRALDPREQTDSTPDQRQSGVNGEEIKAEPVERDSTAENRVVFPPHVTSSSTPKASIDKPMSPLLVLPGDDEIKQSIEENASTRALFHAPMASQVSLAPSHRPTSYTVRSQSDDISTIGDKESATITSAGLDRTDNISTRAVVNAKGVTDVVDRPATGSTRSHSFEPSYFEAGSTQQGQVSTP